METKIKPKHNITIESRKRALISGVEKVVDSNANAINLVTSDGALCIKGDGLKINAFSEADGSLSFEGRVDRMEYVGAKQPLLRRIFK